MSDYQTEVLALTPTGYWRLGEDTGTNAADLGSGANNGTYTNTPTLGVTGALTDDLDTAVTFAQATSEYVTMGDVHDITYDAAFSLSIWAKTTYSATTQSLLGKMDFATPYRGYELRMETTGALSVFVRYSETTNDRILVRTTATGFNDGNWHNVVATYDGSGAASGVTIYVDGVAEALTTVTDNLGVNSLATAISFNVGARGGGGEYFDGTLDEAIIFGAELTAKNVARLYYTGLGHLDRYPQDVLGLNPVGYWRLGEAAGTNAVDESISANNGTYTNTPTLAIEGAISEDTDTAASFASATSEYVTMGNITELNFDRLNPFSVAVWFKTSSTAGSIIVGKALSASPHTGWGVYSDTDGGLTLFIINTSGGTNQISVDTTANGYNDDLWHMAIMTYDGSSNASGVTMYIDGTAVAMTTVYDTLSAATTSSAPANIAARNNLTQHFDGEVDDVAVYDYELSAVEAAFLYASATYVTPAPGLDADYRNTVLGLCPLGYWRLGEASGTNAVDEMLRNDGTYANTPTLGEVGALTGDTDTAVLFASATSEHVTMGDVLDQGTTDAFSAVVWFKASTQGALATLFGKLTSATPVRGWGIHMNTDGTVYVVLSNTDVGPQRLRKTSTLTFDDNTWHCMVFTYDGSSNATGLLMYVDGELLATTTNENTLDVGETISNTASLAIAGRNASDNYFNGSIDEAAIFPSELTVKDVAAMYYKGLDKSGYEYEVLKLAPTSYWRLGEASGTNAVDEVGNFNGTYVNTPTLGATSLVPVDTVDTAVTFAGASSEYVSMGNNLEFVYNEPFSFCFWVNTTDTAGAYIAKYNDTTPKGFTFHVNTDLAFIWRETATTNEMKITYGNSGHIYDGNDHFVVVTYDGSTNASGVNLYIDGVSQTPSAVDTDNLAATPSITDVFCLATQRAGNNIPLTGTMDEVAVFLHELTIQEAHDLYTYGMLYRTPASGFTDAMWMARPIAYWRLGETVGTNAADELGLNNGTYTNTPTLGVAGAISSDSDLAASFLASSSEYVAIGNVLDFDYDEPFSVSAWFKTASATTTQIISKSNATTPHRGWGVNKQSTGEIQLYLQNTSVGPNAISVKTTATTFDDDVWHHVVATYDGSTNASGVSIYVDGVLEATTTVSDTLTATTVNSAATNIGTRAVAGNFMDGEIDEVALFDYELTGAQARRIYWEAAGYSQYPLAQLVQGEAAGYWRLGEASGTNAVDVTGNNNGTYTNTPTLGETGAVQNNTDTAALFASATSEYTTMGDVLDFEYNDTYTVAAWIKTSDSSGNALNVVAKQEDTGNVRGWRMYVQGVGYMRIQISSVATTNDLVVDSTVDLRDGAWHHVAFSYDGSTAAAGIKIYVDGVAVATTTIRDLLGATATTVSAAALNIAGRNSTDQFFNGSVDEVVVYNGVRTAGEICSAYVASLLSYTATGAASYSEAITENPSIAGLVGASADHSLTDASAFTQTIITYWGRTNIESFNLEVGIGLITTITESYNLATSIDTIRYMIGSAVEGVQLALTENIEHAKGVLEGLAMNEVGVASTILQGNISEAMSYADVIRLTWDQFETETVNITDANAVYANKAAALAELFVAAGIVSTIHKAAGIIAEALILQDLVERFFELSAVDSVTMTDAEATLYRAVAANIEAAAMADSLSGSRRLSLLVSDALTGGDSTDIAQRLQAALADGAVFGGAITLPDGVFSAIVLNTESMGISEYTNYPFNSFGKLGNDYLGASDTDVYKLTGADDAGTDIDAVIRTGMTNFGTNVFKRVPRAYLGYTSDGGLIMKTISTSGGTKTERWYELTPRTVDHASDAHAAARIKLGRGIKATYWQFELTNKLGSDFDIDMLQLYPMILSRRV